MFVRETRGLVGGAGHTDQSNDEQRLAFRVCICEIEILKRE